MRGRPSRMPEAPGGKVDNSGAIADSINRVSSDGGCTARERRRLLGKKQESLTQYR